MATWVVFKLQRIEMTKDFVFLREKYSKNISCQLFLRHDSQHDDTEHNDTHHHGIYQNDTHYNLGSVATSMLSVTFLMVR